MAAYDIQKHFSGLRVQTARRRRDPFATGFEDDSEDEGRKSRTKTKAPAVVKPKAPPVVAPPKATIAESNPFASIDQLRDSDDDFLDVPVKKRNDRRPSPAPAKLAARFAPDSTARRGSLPGALPSTNPKKAVELAAGPLAYLDDSSDDEPPVRSRQTERNYSPAPAHRSSPLADGTGRSQTPRGDKPSAKEQAARQSAVVPPVHTVASPFAGTKYLQDSDSDEEAVSSRKNSADSVPNADPPEQKAGSEQKQNSNRLEVKRVDKPKQNGSGVSWRAFSASRAEQRFAEVEALQASLQQRGRSISFCPTVVTDDGRRIPLSPTSERGPGPLGAARAGRRGKSKSPPRSAKDTQPEDDEMADREPVGGQVRVYDPISWKTNPFSGEPVPRSNSNTSTTGDDKQFRKAADSVPDIRIDDISK